LLLYELWNNTIVMARAVRIGRTQAESQQTGHSVRLSSGNGVSTGQIVGMSNGEGRGVACRVVSQKKI